MPYKDKEKAREYARKAMQIKREGITGQGITGQGITGYDSYGKAYTTYFKDGVEYVPADGMLPERPRFLTLSDGTVWDRTNQPKPGQPSWSPAAMAACNRAAEFKSIMSPQERLARVLMALNKEVTGLEGKVNLREMVWYGGFSLEEIASKLR